MASMEQTTNHSLVKSHIVREHPREPVTGFGVLTWDDDAGRGDGTRSKQATVEVRNISDGGLQMLTYEPIKAGSLVYLTGEEFRCVGTVRYCRTDPEGYVVGLKFSLEPNHKNAVAG